MVSTFNSGTNGTNLTKLELLTYIEDSFILDSILPFVILELYDKTPNESPHLNLSLTPVSLNHMLNIYCRYCLHI